MFEWDEAKRAANIEKHGLDFVLIAALFDGRPTVDVPASRAGEARTLTIAAVNGVFLTAIWTWRGAMRRVISMRRSRDAEKKLYRDLHG